MRQFFDSSKASLRDACNRLLAELPRISLSSSAVWQQDLHEFDEEQFLCAATGVTRVAFKSRDRDTAMFGLGIADRICAASNDDVIATVSRRSANLLPEQCYLGAIRFDEDAAISSEWVGFGTKLFVLPQLLVTVSHARVTLSVTFCKEYGMPWSAWLDSALTLLSAIATNPLRQKKAILIRESTYAPAQPAYFATIDAALAHLMRDTNQQKVVIGRRRSIALKESCDPAELFLRLLKKSAQAFLFFFDCGNAAFFGRSPELLYRREGDHFATESIAGTRPRSANEVHDYALGESLISSLKDNREHALVCSHIEEKLKEFGTKNLFTSNLDVMKFFYVQHLVKRYCGVLGDNVDDATIINTLHPTPAVCGLSTAWAKAFIREHEGFDRGLYAGPIGFISKACAEFSVAIRSALFSDGMLHIYAAGGIVPGSLREQEWEELNNKEKNILSIFDTET